MPPNTATAAAPQGEKKSSFNWKRLLWMIGVQLLITVVLGSFMASPSASRRTAEMNNENYASGNSRGDPSASSASPHTTTSSLRGSKPNGLRPFARLGEPFSLRVDCALSGFEPIVFPRLPFRSDALAALPNTTVRRFLDLSECARQNCSADVRVMWTMRGETFEDHAPLIRFFADKKKKTQLLLTRKTGDNAAQHKHDIRGGSSPANADALEEEAESIVYRGYIQPVLTLSPIVDFTAPLPPNALELVPRMSDDVYGPAIYINNFWVLRSHLKEINATVAAEPFLFTVEILPVPLWKVLMYTQFEASVNQQIGMTVHDLDETKRMFLETNPYLLAVTTIVTILHMLFEYLAFSNDVKFWRGRKNFKGLSLRSVAINCYFQTIIFLYLVDSQDASWTILLPSGVGVLTEYWKLTQVVQLVPVNRTVRGEPEGPGEPAAGHDTAATATASSIMTLFGYTLQFRSSYDTHTRRYDQEAIRVLSYAMIPVLLCYSIYSLVYMAHKSWYSYLIHTQVQFVYMFGFVMMLPQIFVNYKMKSVGQVPWRTFIYKMLNTVIDDLFAFAVKMPWLHRLACFRDDVVFVILLYQRWIYPIDATRSEDGEIEMPMETVATDGDAHHSSSETKKCQ